MLLNAVPFVHDLLTKTILDDDITVDATCGNGNDTLLLAGLSKFVYAFDIQELAIRNTQALLSKYNFKNFKLIHDSHANLKRYITDKVKVVTFNLGYLPGSDKTIQTNEESTLIAIKDSCELLASGGIICITLYVGHIGGMQEAMKVEEFAKSLSGSDFKVVKYDFINRYNSPYVIVIEKQ